MLDLDDLDVTFLRKPPPKRVIVLHSPLDDEPLWLPWDVLLLLVLAAGLLYGVLR